MGGGCQNDHFHQEFGAKLQVKNNFRKMADYLFYTVIGILLAQVVDFSNTCCIVTVQEWGKAHFHLFDFERQIF